jgi:protein associated with RNAse G/E
MKNLNKIALILVVILLTSTSIFAQGSYSEKDSNNNVEYFQSKKRFTTNYMVESNDRRYYTNSILIDGNTIIINEYRRDGSIWKTYTLPIEGLKIYKSRNYEGN